MRLGWVAPYGARCFCLFCCYKAVAPMGQWLTTLCICLNHKSSRLLDFADCIVFCRPRPKGGGHGLRGALIITLNFFELIYLRCRYNIRRIWGKWC
jgi:hypothetical protein